MTSQRGGQGSKLSFSCEDESSDPTMCEHSFALHSLFGTLPRHPERGQWVDVSERISNYENLACATLCAFRDPFALSRPPALRYKDDGGGLPSPSTASRNRPATALA